MIWLCQLSKAQRLMQCRGVPKRSFNLLPPARACVMQQCQRQPKGHEHTRAIVVDFVGQPRGLTRPSEICLRPGSGLCLHFVATPVTPGAVIAKSTDRGVDDFGFDLDEVLIADAQPLCHTMSEVLHDDVSGFDQLPKNLQIL